MDPGALLLLAVTAVLLFTLFSRGRRHQRDALSVQSRLAPGAEVMTSSGLIAFVVEVEDSVVVLETAPGQRSRWDRRAVARVITEAGGPEADPTEETDPEPRAGGVPEAPRPEDPETPGRE